MGVHANDGPNGRTVVDDAVNELLHTRAILKSGQKRENKVIVA